MWQETEQYTEKYEYLILKWKPLNGNELSLLSTMWTCTASA